MSVLTKAFMEMDNELQVSNDLFVMYYLYDTKVLVRWNMQGAKAHQPYYFFYDGGSPDTIKHGKNSAA